MSDKQRDRISFRLRKIDGDLREATANLTESQLSELARDGLRWALGIRTTKRIEVTERPLIVPQQPASKKTEVRSTPAPSVFIPQNKRT